MEWKGRKYRKGIEEKKVLGNKAKRR